MRIHGSRLAWLAAFALLLGACSSDADGGGSANGGSTDAGSHEQDGSAADGSAADGSAADGNAADAGPSADGSSSGGADGSGSGDAGSSEQVWAVGVTTIEIEGAAGRKLPTEVWYPIEPGSKGNLAKYALGLITSPGGALRDVPAAKGPFPVVAFSHGNQGIRDQSVFLTEHLARHGYVVISPDHIGNTITTFDNKLAGVMALWRPQDIKAAIDRLAKPEKSDPAWLAGLADVDNVAVTGHSFGGFTTLAVAGIAVDLPGGATIACDKRPKDDPTCVELGKLGEPPWDLSDKRVDVAIPLAHALYGAGGLNHASAKKLDVPVVMMAATGDTLTPAKVEAEPLYADLTSPAAIMLLQGGDHFSFANLCELKDFPAVPASLKATLAKICAPSAIPTMKQTHDAVAKYALAACDIWLKGDDAKRSEFAEIAKGKTYFTLRSKGIVK